MLPKLTVITVSFNSEKTIARTIKSVLSQTFDDYEYIIIDGGSTDSTVDIIKSFEESFYGKLRYLSEPDDGIYYAMNKGLDLASGQYIGIINSDDWYEENIFENINKHIDRESADVYFGSLNVWDHGEMVRVYCNFPSTIDQESLAHPSTFISKETYEKYGNYEKGYKSAADYELFVRLLRSGCSFKYVNLTIANFSRGGISGKTIELYFSCGVIFNNWNDCIW